MYRCYSHLKEGTLKDTGDQEIPGRPRTATDEAHKEMAEEMIMESEGLPTKHLLQVSRTASSRKYQRQTYE